MSTQESMRKMMEYGERRKVARERGLCKCANCTWQGNVAQLLVKPFTGRHAVARPGGLCPVCKKRPFWAKLTREQFLLLT